MKDMTKHSYSAAALAVVGLFAFAACSMQPKAYSIVRQSDALLLRRKFLPMETN